MIKFTIPFRLPSLNEYTKDNRNDKNIGNRTKQKTESDILKVLMTVKGKIQGPIKIKFTWHEKTYRRDKDNVAFAKKFILDALQKSKILPNDNNKYVQGFEDKFVYKQGDSVVVEIEEIEEN